MTDADDRNVRIVGGPLDGNEWKVDIRCGHFMVPYVIKRPMPSFVDGGEDIEVIVDSENIVYRVHEFFTGNDESQFYAVPEGASHYEIPDRMWASHKNMSLMEKRVSTLESQHALDCDTIETLTQAKSNLEEELAAAESIITLLELGSHGHLVDEVRETLGTDPHPEDDITDE